MAAPLKVDGRRPAVERVAMLPRSWRLSDAEWRVLIVLACDSYDGDISAPGLDNLAAWTGLLHGSVAAAITRLCEPTEHRPALLERLNPSRGRHRTEYQLLLPRDAAEIAEYASAREVVAAAIGTESVATNPPANPPANRPVSLDGKPSSEPSSEPSGFTGHPYIDPLSLQASSLFPAAQPAPNAHVADDDTAMHADDDELYTQAREALTALGPERYQQVITRANLEHPNASTRERIIAALAYVGEVA